MAYSNGTSTTMQNLFDNLSTFAVANGWTQDHAAAGRLFLTKSTCSVAFRWSTTTPTVAAVYQHTAFIAAGTDPGNHTLDSGQGAISGTDATLAADRRVDLPNTTMQHWFFEGDDYIHVVVEASAGVAYRHFGFGILDKFGTWTGGAYSYGQRHSNDGGTGTLAVRADSASLMDGLSNGTEVDNFQATLHISGLPSQGTSVWGLVSGGIPTTNDRAGNLRHWIVGGFRCGPTTGPLGRFSGTPLQGILPLTPLNLFYRRPSASILNPLGTMPAVAAVNMKNYVGGQEVAVGGDTWVLFPTREKGSGAAGTGTGNGTRNQGIAYLKNP